MQGGWLVRGNIAMAEPIIETTRLLMRPPRACDLDGWAAFGADELATRYLGGVQSRPEAWRSLAGAAGSWSLQGFGVFSVILRETGQWIGRIGPLRPEGWPAAEIGWGLLPAFWGLGYAIEGATAAASFAFEQLGWDEIGHVIDPANQASIVVARALGSHLLKRTQLPEPYTKEHVDLWGQNRTEWRARHAVVPARRSDPLVFTISDTLDAATETMIEDGLDAYNRSQVGPDPSRPLWVTCRDAGGEIIGGARCVVMWQWLLVDWLWVTEPHRRSGLGSDLLHRVEQAGIAEGCTGAMLNTFSFQAPDFYRRHGYAVFGELDGFAVRHTRYWMSKALARSSE